MDDDYDDYFGSTGHGEAGTDRAPGAGQPQRLLPPRLGMLADLSDEEFDAVARSAKLTHVAAESMIFRHGDAADRFFIVVDGLVDVERDDEVLATLGPGAFFGESALLVQGRRSASVIAIADTSLWSISYDAFDAAMAHHLLAGDTGSEAARRIAQTPRGAFDERSCG